MPAGVLVDASTTGHHELDRPGNRTRVVIAGHAAKLRREGGVKEAVYDAFVSDSSLRAGRSYGVRITVVSASGAVTARREHLYLHKTFPRT